jgi:hypothetical protein
MDYYFKPIAHHYYFLKPLYDLEKMGKLLFYVDVTSVDKKRVLYFLDAKGWKYAAPCSSHNRRALEQRIHITVKLGASVV